ncbi:MAG: hypothetical protein P4L83_03530 [Nevskia sp.]|nr:hypothetical protein [Nevskia sp.]
MNRSQMERALGGPVEVRRPIRFAKSRWFWQTGEKHLWCRSCARTFPNGTYRLVDGDKRCPYADCNGEVAHDAREWSSIQRERPNYPADPWLGIQYPCRVPAAGSGLD